MIKVTVASMSDIEEAIIKSREDIYCSEELSARDIAGNPFAVSLWGPDSNLGAIAGIDIIRPGVAEGWMVTTQGLRCFPLAYTRKMLIIVEESMTHFSLHRLQVVVKCRSDLVKWAQYLGFEIEGKMMQFGKDKSDYYMMGRTR